MSKDVERPKMTAKPNETAKSNPPQQIKETTVAPDLTVTSIMSNSVFVVPLYMTIQDAIGFLLKNKVRGVPVVDPNGKLASVITESDLMRLAANKGLDTKIENCMNDLVKLENLVTLKKQATFAEAYRTFLSKSVHRIIVVDDSGRVQGLVSRSNVLQVLYGPKLEAAKVKAEAEKPKVESEKVKAESDQLKVADSANKGRKNPKAA
jgi:predicted transcriptional regulator